MSEPGPIYIVDDEEGVRKSLSFTLRTAGYQVHSWANGAAFLKEARNLPLGCILLDMHMSQMDGLEVQAEMAMRGIRMPIVVLTGHGNVTLAVRSMKLGAIDFIEKPFERSVLLQAVTAAFDNLAKSTRELDEAVNAKLRLACLTPRELEVLTGLAQGLPNKSIAYDLGISSRTVEVHRAHLMDKLGVISFPEALRIAFAAKLGHAVA